MANVDHIKVGSTSYDISPSPTGTLTTGTGGFSSSDVAQGSATSWTNVDQITTSDKHASIFTKITQMAKNVRYLYNVLGTGFSTGSTVKSQIDGKAPSSHSHSVGQLPTSSTQVNSNDYIPTSALIYSMNQTLTSLNDASSIKIKQRTQTIDDTYLVRVKMTSSYYSSEYLISVIPDTTNYTGLILVDVLHTRDISLNENILTYDFYTYKLKYGDNYTFTKVNANGTVYIYYFSI